MADQNDDTDGRDDAGLDISDDDAARLLDADDDTAESDEKSDTRQAEPLGDAGKRAIDAMKRERNAARKEAAELAAKLKAIDDKDKTESQRLQEDRDQHRTRAEKAEAALRRREIAEQLAPDHATVAQIRAVAKRMSGDDDDALEEDARELFDLIAPAPPVRTAQRPKERLRGGSEPEEPAEETDPVKLAALIPRRR
jgi:hypothetical protein